MWKTVFPCWKCCKAWWREHFIYLLLSQTYFKYSHCTSDKPFVNIAGLPLPKRRGEEGCSVGNFFLSLQWFTPHQFHFSIFETPQRPHSHEAGCTLKKRSARKGFTNRYRSHRPQRWTPPFLSTAPALLWTRSRLRPCQLILTQFGPVSRSGKGAPWLRGLPRIPQWGAPLLHASSFHLSIHLSSLLLLAPPSISQCVVIFVCSYPCQDNIVLLSHVFPTHPPLHFTSLPSRFQPCI